MKQCNVKSLVSMTWVYRLSIEPTVVQWYGISLLRCINRLWYQAATSNHGTCLMCLSVLMKHICDLYIVTILKNLLALSSSFLPSWLNPQIHLHQEASRSRTFLCEGEMGFFFMRETMSYLRFSSGSALCKIKLALPSPRWNSRPTITCKTGRFYIERCQVRTILTR